MTAQELLTIQSPDIRNSLAAMFRAAEMARQIARQTNTPLVLVENGKTILIAPDRLDQMGNTATRQEGIKPIRPSVALDMKRSQVRETVSRFRTANPRVFGSVLHGTDRADSDIDLLVDALPGATLLDLGGLQEELQLLLGVNVDLLTPGDLPLKFRASVLTEAQPV